MRNRAKREVKLNKNIHRSTGAKFFLIYTPKVFCNLKELVATASSVYTENGIDAFDFLQNFTRSGSRSKPLKSYFVNELGNR